MKKITVENINGTMEEVELINSFNVKDINRNFAIISKGESLNDTMSKVYISEVVEESPGVLKLIGITDESVWDKVKHAMKEIVQDENYNNSGVTLDSKIKSEGFRAIGLKNSDVEKFNKVQESSFKVNEGVTETVSENNPVLEQSVSSTPTSQEVKQSVPAMNEQTATINPTPEPIVEQAPVVEPVVESTSQQVEQPIVNEVPQTNIFDTPVPEHTTVIQPEPEVAPQTEAPAFDMPVINYKKESEIIPNASAPLETPVEFYKSEEAETNAQMTEDPALAYLDSIEELVINAKEIIKSKNETIKNKDEMIKALNQKITILTDELNKAKMPEVTPTMQGTQRVFTPNNTYNQAA